MFRRPAQTIKQIFEDIYSYEVISLYKIHYEVISLLFEIQSEKFLREPIKS